MSWYDAAFARHYPVLYRHRDDAEAEYWLNNLTRLVPLGAGPVLDLGCGEGRHLAHLSVRGIRTVGLDLSAELLQMAYRRRARAHQSFALVRGDMRAQPFAAGSFTAVLSLFTAFGYFGGLEEHRGILAEIARVLVPGGHWVLDYLNCDAVRRELAVGPDVRNFEREPFLVREERRLHADPLQVRKAVTLLPLPGSENRAAALGVSPAGLHYEERVALFDRAKIAALAAGQGLAQVASAGDYDLQTMTATSARWVFVFRLGAAA